MIKLFFLILFLLFFQLKIWAASGKSPRNILFIAVDDLKPTLGCYGDTLVFSPHIDSLASQGTVFFNNYCQQAVCAPSRASLLTGWRPDRTQVWDLKTLIRDKNPDVVTLPQYFREHGYETAAVGKVFDPRSVDSDHDAPSWSLPYRPARGNRWIYATEKVSTEIVDEPDSVFMDGHILSVGLQLLDELAEGDKPFFLAVGFKKPHLPFVAPAADWNRYARDKIPLAPFQQHSLNAPEFAFQPGWELRNYVDIPDTGRIPDDKQRELINGYYACVTHIDRLVGKLLARLDSLGLADSTIVVLWGDHGWHLGDHLMWAKHTNFEQATRAPLIISAPGFPRGQVATTMSEFVDVFPTLCELAGLPIPDSLDGVSLVPALRDPSVEVKQYAVSQYHRNANGIKVEGYAIRTKRYRYVEWLKQSIRETLVYDTTNVVANELYDYQTDPLETVSLAPLPEYRELVNQFRQILRQYFEDLKKKRQLLDGQNLLKNPGFEFGTTDWQRKQSILAVVDTPVHSGEHALKIVGRTNDLAGLYQDVTVALQTRGPGKYILSGYFRSQTDTAVLGKIKVRLTYGNQQHHIGVIDSMDASGWHFIGDTLQLSWEGNLQEALFFVQTSGGFTGDFFVDDLNLSSIGTVSSLIPEANKPTLPEEFRLTNYPNPFNPQTIISFKTVHQGEVQLNIFDTNGRLVRRLINRFLTPGSYRILWNGVSDQQEPVASGFYFAVLKTGGLQVARKMLLLR